MGMSITLSREGEANTQRHEFQQERITMGRHRSNHLQLPENGISRTHAEVLKEGKHFFLMDLGSTNGTYLNGRRLEAHDKALLKSGDTIQIEAFRMTYAEDALESMKQSDEATEIVAMRMVREVIGGLESGRVVYLKITQGMKAGESLAIEEDMKEIIIGRDDSCQLTLPDDSISRQHVKIVRDWSGFSVVDMGSKNGALVNGRKISNWELTHGDEIQLGPVIIQFIDPQAPNQAPAKASAQPQSAQTPAAAPHQDPEAGLNIITPQQNTSVPLTSDMSQPTAPHDPVNVWLNRWKRLDLPQRIIIGAVGFILGACLLLAVIILSA